MVGGRGIERSVETGARMAPGSPLRRRLRETVVAASARALSTSTARQRLWTEIVLREASPSAGLLEDRRMQFMALCAAMGRRSHAQLFQMSGRGSRET